MKILYIKAGKIDEKTGGGFESYKILYSLREWISKNPEDEFLIISEDLLDVEAIDTPVKKKWKDFAARFFLHSNYMYIDYKINNLKKFILHTKYDVVILGNSRLGFIAKDIKKRFNDTKVIIHYDNVEFDYIDAYFLEETGIKNKLYKFIEKISVKRDEGSSVMYGDINILLTERDKNRLNNIYGINSTVNKIIPICLEEGHKPFRLKNSKYPNLFFIGSLWYKSNSTGITWFLDNIWVKIKNKFPDATLTIGGSKPSKELSEKIELDKSIRFFPNFNRIEDILYSNSILISPIQKGAGMKIKIAEALSMGFPVIASEESLVGYEEAYTDSLSRGLMYNANSFEGYIKSIEEISRLEFSILSNNARKLFRKYYSLKRAADSMEDLLSNIKRKRNK